MTVREACQNLVSLTGVLSLCGEADCLPLKQAAVNALNQALQEMWLSPTGEFQTREQITVTFAAGESLKVLPLEVQTVIGPVTTDTGARVTLAATQSEFDGYYEAYDPRVMRCVARAPGQGQSADYLVDYDDDPIIDFDDDPIILALDDVTLLYGQSARIQVARGKGVVIYFDNEAQDHKADVTIGRLDVPVPVILPELEETTQAAVMEKIMMALARYAGQWVIASLYAQDGQTFCSVAPRKAGVDAMGSLITINGTDLEVTPVVIDPEVAFVQSVKNTEGSEAEMSRQTIKVAPPFHKGGELRLWAILHAPRYTVDDIACGGISPAIRIAHEYCETLLMPIAREKFVEANTALLPNEVLASRDGFISAAHAARVALGLASPRAPQKTQRDKTPDNAHA